MRCAQKGCGSYAFNLAHDGVDQGSLCDVHYWQSQANQLKALNAELAAALSGMVEITELTIGWLPTPPNADGPLIVARAALAKHNRETQ